VDKVAHAMQGMEFERIASNLSKDEEDNLRAAFARRSERQVQRSKGPVLSALHLPKDW